MKKHITYLFFVTMAVIFFNSCKKDAINTTSLASLKLVNEITDGVPVRLGNYGLSIPSNVSYDFSLRSGGDADIYVWPEGDSLHPYYHSNKSVAIAEGDLFTLFLGGTPGNAESILIKEDLPPIIDSVAKIRFINLSPDSPPVNVTLSTSTSTNEFEDIAYKQLTDFKSFPAKMENTTYTFEVRNANTNAIISSITMNSPRLNNASFVPRFRHVTLVFRGMVGGSPAAGITRINHYRNDL